MPGVALAWRKGRPPTRGAATAAFKRARLMTSTDGVAMSAGSQLIVEEVAELKGHQEPRV